MGVEVKFGLDCRFFDINIRVIFSNKCKNFNLLMVIVSNFVVKLF